MRSIAVLGLGNYGSSVARELTELGVEVIAVDERKERVEAIKDSVAFAVVLNATDEAALKAVAIQDVDVAVVSIGEDVEASLLTTLLLKKIGVKKIWARAINSLQYEILKRLDVDEIVSLEEEMGKTVARSLASASESKRIPLSDGHSLAEVRIPKPFVGKTLRQINPRGEYNVNIVAIKTLEPAIDDMGERRFAERFNDVPSPDEKLSQDDVLLVAGTDKNIEKFAKGQV